MHFICVIFFFFKQKTAYEMRISDWSSDVCSSDLGKMSTHRDAIRELGGPHKVASGLSEVGVRVKLGTVRAWSWRGNIPSKYWPHIQTLARAKGKPTTITTLAEDRKSTRLNSSH